MNAASGDLVKYRLARARETLQDARLLARGKRWKSCVNRLYYACFYAVLALLERHGMATTKHTGVRSLFNRNFVKTGRISRDLAATYNHLFDQRHESDYVDFLTVNAEDVRPHLAKAGEFISTVTKLANPPRGGGHRVKSSRST